MSRGFLWTVRTFFELFLQRVSYLKAQSAVENKTAALPQNKGLKCVTSQIVFFLCSALTTNQKQSVNLKNKSEAKSFHLIKSAQSHTVVT